VARRPGGGEPPLWYRPRRRAVTNVPPRFCAGIDAKRSIFFHGKRASRLRAHIEWARRIHAKRPCERPGMRRSAGRAGAEVPERPARISMAIGFPFHAAHREYAAYRIRSKGNPRLGKTRRHDTTHKTAARATLGSTPPVGACYDLAHSKPFGVYPSPREIRRTGG